MILCRLFKSKHNKKLYYYCIELIILRLNARLLPCSKGLHLLAIHHSVNVYPDMSEDEYVEMQENPVHLAIYLLRSFQSPPIVLSSLGAKLEAKEAEVIQKNDEIEILKEETKSIPDILTLIRENSTYIEENKTLKQRLSQLEKEKSDLVKRLEADAAHYKKLAAEKQTWEKAKLAQGEATDDNCVAKIESLESKIVQLSKELRDARTSQDMQLSQISKAVSIVSMSASERDIDSLDSSISGLSNMDSVKIGNALQGTQSDLPSLFQPFPPSLEAPETSTPATSLPPPLPVNADPTVPEMQPRTPAPYSSSGPSSGAGPVEDPKRSVSLECPLCNESFPDHSEEQLQQHVDVHLEQVVECPICGKTYDPGIRRMFSFTYGDRNSFGPECGAFL